MKKYLALGAIILVAAVVINFSLGGFKPVEPQLISTDKTILYGFNYEGQYNSDSLDSQINYLRSLLEDKPQAGTLCILNYIQPNLEKRGVVKQFVGINWQKGHQPTNLDLDSLVIEAYNGIQFVVPIKPLVMPSPEKLKSLAANAALEMNYKLKGFSIEYYENRTLVVSFPLK